ncbi:MAG: cell division protein FtsA [Bdellovibrionales bacterium]|nr:cell division protein FtsA [Bdellovibrionales bacterium]
MSKSTQRSLILAALDIGTTKVSCAISKVSQGQMDVIGVGTASNSGMRQGVVTNIEAVSESIRKAKEEAELMSGVEVFRVWLGIGGTHIQSFDSQGMIAIRNKEVSAEDIERVIEAAKAVAIPSDRQVLHVLPKEFKIDGQSGIHDPIGMSGVRLECSVHIVTGSNSAIQNAIKCTQKAGLQVSGLVLQQLASSLAVLSPDEKNLGCCVVDMGGGTCDLISYYHGSVVHTGVIAVGGQNFSHDVAMGLRTTATSAENLKKKFGSVLGEALSSDESIEVESVGGRANRTVARRDLCDVLEARAEETLSLIRAELDRVGMISYLGSGVVLTGGASQLQGLAEIGDFAFDVPVRRGVPRKVGGLTDIVKCASYSTVVGLLFYGQEQEKERLSQAAISEDIRENVSGWWNKVKEFFAG